MINNLEQIKNLLKFEDENDFYFLQILKRKKENPEQKGNSRVIKTYYITSIEHLDDKFEEIKLLANFNNARVYINLNKRNFEKCTIKTAQLLLEQAINKDWKSSKNAFDSICGRYHSDTDKNWIVDIDEKEVSPIMCAFIEYKCEPISTFEGDYLGIATHFNGKIKAVIPTKNGFHLITSPFNTQKFKEEYPNIEIHKNNPTILYIPDILEVIPSFDNLPDSIKDEMNVYDHLTYNCAYERSGSFEKLSYEIYKLLKEKYIIPKLEI